jgi:hypothetical protein
MCQYLQTYLAADGATVRMVRCTNKSQGNHSSGYPWWQMAAYVWLQNVGYPCSVYASYTGDCTTGTGASESNDDIRSRPLASDYDNSNIYVSVHTNGYTGDCTGSCPTGTETYYDNSTEHAPWGAISQTLANNINSSIMSAITANVDSTWTCHGTCVKDSAGNYGEIRIPDRAATLTELAFHDTCDRDADANHLNSNFFRSAAMWGIYKGICQYFGTSPTWDFYSDEYVSDTIPTAMTAGQSYNVSITFRNRGVLWTTAKGFRLGAVGDSDPFTSFNRVDISGEVGPGSTYTFSFTMVAPAQGTYTTDWRMVRDGYTWFGATLTKQVNVSGGGPQPPAITQHPNNQTIPPYGTASFTVQATGDAPLSYQWQKDGSNLSDGGRISGATTATLQILNADAADQGSYRCIVSNPYGSAISNSASLTLAPAVFIVESRSGGQNYANYSEVGTWADSTAKSTAPGVTAGIGSRVAYISTAGRDARSSFTPLVTGTYEVAATWPSSTNTPQSCHYIVAHAGGAVDVYLDQNNNTNPGGSTRWNSLGQYTFNAGTAYLVTLTTTGSTQGSGGTALRSDAIRWEFRSGVEPPTITQQPAARNVCPGGTATFTVAATGSGTLTYQWQRNGVNLSNGGNISGALTPTLTVANVSVGDAADYRCAVSNAGGRTDSNPAALTIRAATEILAHPSPLTVCAGDAAQFTVTAAGDGTLTYQWQKDGANLSDGANISGTRTATLRIDPAGASDAATYRCVVTAGCGSVTSDGAGLTVRARTTITHQPQSQNVCAGATVSFSVEASGEGTLQYQWQKDGSDIEGATAATLQIAPAGSAAIGVYRCAVTGDCGTVLSDEAALTVTLYVADFDEDCDTDLADFAKLQACFNGPNQPAKPGCEVAADLDGDADVDLADFARFQACFNGPNRAPKPDCPTK